MKEPGTSPFDQPAAGVGKGLFDARLFLRVELASCRPTKAPTTPGMCWSMRSKKLNFDSCQGI
jgi:hypothetical protein